MLGTWPDIVAGEVVRLPFYRWSLGVDDPAKACCIIGKSILWYGALLAPPALLGIFLRPPGHYRDLMFASSLLLATTGFLAWWPVWWPATIGPLPMAMILLASAIADGTAATAAGERRYGRFPPHRRADADPLRAAAAVKILLFARTSHYGFALAMPATLLAIVALFDWLPASIERGGGYGGLLRAAALAVCCAFVLGHLAESRHYVGLKTVLVGSGSDAFRADERGHYVNEMLAEIEHRPRPVQRWRVLPAGVMLNYLSRRANPTPFIYLHARRPDDGGRNAHAGALPDHAAGLRGAGAQGHLRVRRALLRPGLRRRPQRVDRAELPAGGASRCDAAA